MAKEKSEVGRVVRALGKDSRLIEAVADLDIAAIELRPVRVLRPEDLVDLTFSFENLTLKSSRSKTKPAVLVRRSPTRRGLLTLGFPPQHTSEQTFHESLENNKPVLHPPFYGPPVKALFAGPTQLVFVVHDEEIPFTLEGILAACSELELLVSAGALPARTMRLRKLDPVALLATKPGIRLTAADRTAGTYEAMYRLTAMVGTLAHRFGPEVAIEAARNVEIASKVGAVAKLGLDLVKASEIIEAARLKVEPSDPIAAGRTAIELPFRLLLSPHSGARFRHAAAPVTHDQRVELWHSRLGEAGTPEVDLAPASRTVRALWTRDWEWHPFKNPAYPNQPPRAPRDFPDERGGDDQPGWLMPMSAYHRMSIVHETSNFTLLRNRKSFEPETVAVRRLMLSTLGGWLDSRLTVDDFPDGFDLQEWRHRAAMGRDFYVKIVLAGYLFPFGHRAVLIEITEREFRDGPSGEKVAYLVKREFVAVKELLKTFGNSNRKVGDQHVDNVMPFRTVRFITQITPQLDPRETYAPAAGNSPQFFPVVDHRRFPFKVVASDVEGNVVEFAIPLLFVSAAFNQSELGKIADKYNAENGDVAGVLNGQRVAFAPHEQPDDTSAAVTSMRFKGTTFNAPTGDPGFTPYMRDAQVVVPSVVHLSGNTAPVKVTYHKAYGKDAFAGANTGHVFLEVDKDNLDKANLDFSKQSDRSGGLVSPSLRVTALSRKTGPVGGDSNAVAGGSFTPSDFFKGLDGAKLFGAVKLTELIKPASFAGDLAKIPKFVTQSITVITALTSDLATLTSSISGLGATGAAVKTEAAKLITALDPAKLKTALPNPAPLSAAITALRNDAAFKALNLRDLDTTLQRVKGVLDDAAGLLEALKGVRDGLAVKEIVRGHLEWRPDLIDLGIITPDVNGNPGSMVVAVDLRATPGSATPVADVSCRIENVTLHLLPAPNDFIEIPFERITFTARAGEKPEVDVKLGQLGFLGVLSFVDKLREFIPSDGFSDPPYLDVSSTGLKAGYSLALPPIAVGVFSLENVSLGADLHVPFIGDALEFSFNFCTREKPFHLIVSLFGGGGFFGVTVTPNGLKVLEAALEFGAAISINLGVASGGVSIMAGIYFKMEIEGGENHASLTGYLRIRGEVDVLGLISASIELYMSFTYEFSTGKAVGRATIHVEVHVLFFSASVAVSCEKKFAGSTGDPSFADLMQPVGAAKPWNDYCRAFGRVA